MVVAGLLPLRALLGIKAWFGWLAGPAFGPIFVKGSTTVTEMLRRCQQWCMLRAGLGSHSDGGNTIIPAPGVWSTALVDWIEVDRTGVE